MPLTVNGIGTHYYGEKNVATRTAVCKSCGRAGVLTSYDTRLWFVVVFIPIIPLGRKRIIDQCPSCSRHYAMNAGEYEQAKQLQTSGSLERFRREPTTAAAAEAHGQLMDFHEFEQAADFRRAALERFPDDSGLRSAMAQHLWNASVYEESGKLFREALEIDPDSPQAREGTARFKSAEGNLDEALDLLDFLMEPGAGSNHPLEPLYTLAARFQAVGRHEDALKLAETLQREIPSLHNDHGFRSFVKRSEKAAGRAESSLPKPQRSIAGLFRSEGSPYAPWQRKTAIGGLAAALILVGLALNNEYIRRHRTLHVLNATGTPAQVQIDDQPPATVSDESRLTVAEGPHVVKITGPVDETHQIALESGYIDRWSKSPVWILNPGGEAVLDLITHVYTMGGGPTRRERIVGQAFFHQPHVDYLFTRAPDKLKVENDRDEILKTEIEWTRGEDLDVFQHKLHDDRAAAMDFVEKRLRRDPDQRKLLRAYVEAAAPTDVARVEGFLKSGLDRRPLNVGWHQAWQTAVELAGDPNNLAKYYDDALKSDPSNAALLYLRGRIDANWDAQVDYYNRSIAADPKFPWTPGALAAMALAEGRWDDALEGIAKTRELSFEDKDRLAEMTHEALLGKRDYATAIEKARETVAVDPMNLTAVQELAEAQAAAGDGSSAQGTLAAFAMRLPGEMTAKFLPHMKAMAMYLNGDAKACAEFCSTNSAMTGSQIYLHAMLALGRSTEAAADPAFASRWDDPIALLSLAMGLTLEGKTEAAEQRRETGAARLIATAGATDAGKAGRMLTAAEPPPIRDVVRLGLPPELKALILAGLAEKHPAERAAFLAEAARYDVGRYPPHLLIQRAVTTKAVDKP